MFSFVIHQPILLYAFQVIACSAICWFFYKGVVERGQQFAFSRGFLLFALMGSVIIPLFSIPILPATFSISTEFLEYPTDLPANMPAGIASQTGINPMLLVIFIYLAVCTLLIVKFGLQLLSLYRIYRSGHKVRERGCLIIHSSKIESPFSFVRTIYLPNTLETSEEKLFLLHECAHVRKRHSLDILFYEIVSIFFWFNPIFRFMGMELKKIHEYQADRATVSSMQSTRTYQNLIAKEFLGFSPKIVNAFNGSLTKNRIIMLTKPFKTNRIILRMALIIPLTALNLLLFSCKARESGQIPVQEPNNKVTATEATSQPETTKPGSESEAWFELVEVRPTFQGGDENTFSKWVGEQIKYPESAKNNGVQGRVMLTFVIDTDGSLIDVSVLRAVDTALDAEAVRVLSSSPKWTPGMHEGKKVKVQYNFPVTFQLR